MSSDFKSWFEAKIEELNRDKAEIQSKIDHYQGILNEYEATHPKMSTLFDGAKSAPSAALESIFDRIEDREISTQELKNHLDEMRDADLLDSKPERSTSEIMHAGLNNLVKKGFVVKTKSSTSPKGPAYYRKL